MKIEKGAKFRKRKGLIFVVIFATLALSVSAGCASAATTHYVNPGESIQAAVDAADPGDTVIVKDGTYTENVDVNKRLTVRSENGSASISVQASDTNDHVFEVTVDYVNISGFTVKGATEWPKGGIYLNGVEHCNIVDNNASNNDRGISLDFSSNNMVSNNCASNNNWGIELSSSSYNIINGNNANSSIYAGISLSSSSNNTLSGNNVSNNDWGISLDFSSNNTISGNNALNNRFGIRLYDSSDNTLSENNANSNKFGIFLLPLSNSNIITDNIANSNTGDGIRFENSSNNTLTNNNASLNNRDGICLEYSNNNMISGNKACLNGDQGIELRYSSYNNITNNNLSSNIRDGIFLEHSCNHNTITNNTACLNGDEGIDLDDSCNYNNIVDNNVSSNIDDGIKFEHYSNHNNITGNIICLNGGDGIEFENPCSNNTIANNTIYANDEVGIRLESSSYNQIYHNDFIDNEEQAYDDGESNSWDKGPVTGGNYWSDHTCTGNPSDGSQPYYIDADSIDHYPFEGRIHNVTLPQPQAKSEINVFKQEYLSLSIRDAHINHSEIYNFTPVWLANVWKVKNLDNVTYTITTAKNFTYISNWELYQNGTDRSFYLPPTIEGQNYTWVLPLKDRIGSMIIFASDSLQTVQDNPWADMDVNATYENGYTRVNVTFTPTIHLDWVELEVKGEQIIDVTAYPSEFELESYTSSYINFSSGEIDQGQTYEFSILIEKPDEVITWLDSTFGWVKEPPSDTITLPVTELGNVTVKADVPVKWEHRPTLPAYVQRFVIEFEEEKPTHTDTGVTVDIEHSEPCEIAPLLPPGTDLTNAIVINVNVTDDTPGNSTDDAYTDITINVGELDAETCEVYKEGSGFLPEVDDVATLPTVKPPGEAKFSRDVVNNSVIIRLYVGDPLLAVIPTPIEGVFDTGAGTYPSIMGTHEGTIAPNQDITVHKMYTYAWAGTGGHTEYVRFYGAGLDVNKTWNGYTGDYRNITFDPPITLQANTTYNYEIRTGSYPQIIHAKSKGVTGGTITCTEFVDANGKVYNDWIPAIMLE